MTRPRLLASTALIGMFSLGLTSGQAMAACDINTPTDGQTVTCTGTDTTGISGNANNVTVTQSAATTINTTGINAIDLGTGALVTNAFGASSISSNTTTVTLDSGTISNSGTISSTTGIAIQFTAGTGTSATVTNSGTITGTGGIAIDFGQSNALLNLGAGNVINGNIIAGAGTIDQLALRQGSGTDGTFNVDDIGTKYIGFDLFAKATSNTWTLTGTGSQNWTVGAGTLIGNTASMSGNLAVSSGANATFDQATAGTYTSVISGAGTVTKTGAGDLTLSGTNTYTGGTVINGGSIVVSSDSNLGNVSGNLTLMNGGSLKRAGGNPNIARNVIIGTGGGTLNSNGAAMAVSGVISGTGRLTKNGSSTLTLSGTNTYSGGTTISSGTLLVSSDANLGDVSGDISFNGATLQYGAGFSSARSVTINAGGGTIDTNGFASSLSGVISGSGALTKSGSGTLTLSGTNTYSGGTTITGGTLASTVATGIGSGMLTLDGGTFSINQYSLSNAITLGNSGGTVLNNSGGAAFLTGIISGSGSLTKTGTNSLTLSGTNTYTGGTNISGGVLSIGADVNLGNAAGAITLSGGGNLLFNTGFTTARNISITDSGVINTSANNATISGVISGAGTLAKSGTGILTLSGTNTYTGGTTVSAGILAGTTNSLQGNITNNAQVNFDQSFSGTYAGTMSGTGLLSINNSSGDTFTLSGANTHTGGTTVQGGTLRISADNNLGASNSVLTLRSTTVQQLANISSTRNIVLTGPYTSSFDTNGFSSTQGGVISGSGALLKTGSGTLTLTGTNTYTGNTSVTGGILSVSASNNLGSGGITLNGGTLQYSTSFTNTRTTTLGASGGTIDVATGQTSTMSGVVSGSGSLTKTGVGLLVLSGTNTYTGGTTLSAGTIRTFSDSSLGATSGILLLNNGALEYGASYNSVRNINLIASSANTINTAGFNSTISGVISGTGSFTKTGAGTLTLTGTNTYSGNTGINNGTLNVSADNNLGTGNLVLAGGTLQYGAGFSTTKAVQLVNSSSIDTNSFNSTISGTLFGTGSVTKTGTGTLTLSSTNTYTGGTTINAGSIAISSDSNLGNVSGALTLTNGGSLKRGGSTPDIARSIIVGTGGGILDSNGSSMSVSGIVSGTGRLTKGGGGILTLTGTNTYSGGTSISFGTLNVSSDANLGDTSGDITFNGGTLQYGAGFSSARSIIINGGGGTIDTNTFNSSLSGVISGTGALTKTGSHTLSLTGANTYTGGTVVSGGRLVATTTSIPGDVVNNALFQFVASGTYTGVISGTGTLEKTGTGIVTLTGANTYTGGTTITGTGAYYNISADNNLGATSGALTLNGGGIQYGAAFSSTRNISLGASGGTIDTNGFSSATSGIISGTGSLTKTGTGTLTLSGINTYSGGTTISGGTLNGSTATLQGNIINDAQLRFNQSANGTYAGIISGIGSVTKSSTGTVIFSGANTYSGGTTISGGTLQVSADNNLGNTSSVLTLSGGMLQYGAGFSSARNISINASNGTIDTNGFNSTVSGIISGVGALTKSGSGTLTLTGSNTYTGGTTVSGGSLVGTNLSLQGNIVNNANITFSQTTNGTYSGIISGTGNLIKSGTGNLILSNINTYSGGTTINAGRLSVNGSITGTTTIGSSGTLGGAGSFGSIVSNGRIAPGNSIGTMAVTGDVTFNSGSIYEVEVDAAGNSDKLIASGALIINGGMLDVMAASGSYADSTLYNILQGSSRTGTFDSITTDLAFLTPTLSYNASSVNLILDRNDVDFAIVAEDEVQAGVANAVQNLGSGSDLYTAFSGLNMQEAAEALDTLSGEHNAGITTATSQSVSTVRNIVTVRVQTIAANGSRNVNYNESNVSSLSPAAGDENSTEIQKNFWSQAFGYTGHSDSQGTAPAQNRQSGGVIFGADADLSSRTFVGALGGYEVSEIYTDSQGANSDVATWHAGVYANHQLTPSWRISANVIGSFHEIDTTRHITFTGYSATPKGETSGYTISPGVETGYSFDVGSLSLEPFIGLNITHSYIGKYTEEQGGSSNLEVDSVSQTNPSHTLGVNLGKSFVIDDERNLNINARLAWSHTYGNLDATQTMQFASGTLPFDVKGAGLSRNSALIGLGGELDIIKLGGKAYVDYTGDLSKETSNHSVTLGVKVPF